MLLTVDLAELLAGKLQLGPCVAALGTFDGVHKGHAAILSEATKLADELNAEAIVCTFDCLPLEVLDPQRAPLRLTTHQRRLALLEAQLKKVVVLRFTTALASLNKQQFVDNVLVRALGCVGAVAGFNYTFGQGAMGTALTLRNLGKKAGLSVRIVDPIRNNGLPISSTWLRELVMAGDVELAATGLDRPFCLEGRIITGSGIGHKLGFPTANLLCDANVIIPANGVYITDVYSLSEDKLLGKALTAISTRPTFNGKTQSVESHILNYEGSLYGQKVSVAFHKHLRSIIQFSQPDELQTQIANDIAAAHHYWTERTSSEAFT